MLSMMIFKSSHVTGSTSAGSCLRSRERTDDGLNSAKWLVPSVVCEICLDRELPAFIRATTLEDGSEYLRAHDWCCSHGSTRFTTRILNPSTDNSQSLLQCLAFPPPVRSSLQRLVWGICPRDAYQGLGVGSLLVKTQIISVRWSLSRSSELASGSTQ